MLNKLLKFQEKLLVITKDSTNPHFKAKYASLPQILDAITPILNELGLLITHVVEELTLITIIHDVETAGTIESSFPISGTKPQEIGSSITYAKRYNIGCLLNLNIDDDDDGNEASKKETKEWYNTFEKDKDSMLKLIQSGERTAQSIIQNLESKYLVSKKIKDLILNLK